MNSLLSALLIASFSFFAGAQTGRPPAQPTAEALPTKKKSESKPAPKKKKEEKRLENAKLKHLKEQMPDEGDDFQDGDIPPPSEEMPIEDTPESEDKSQNEGLNDIQYTEKPDDSGIEYAEDAEKAEKAAEAKRIAEELARKKKPLAKPPADEPMPLIRREREQIDISAKPGPKKIHHPNAAKGLVKITRDKVYIYKTKVSDQTKSSSFRFGFLSPSHLENKDSGLVFDDFYQSSVPSGLIDYEWQFFRGFGKLGLKLGTGIGVAQGNGQFKSGNNGSLEPVEKFTFLIIPNSVGLAYHADFFNRQWIVPYAEGGGTAFVFSEMRNDGKSPKFGGAPGAYFALGGAFNISSLDTIGMLELDREYGINSLFLTAEYRYYAGFGNFDFTSNFINGGLMVEF